MLRSGNHAVKRSRDGGKGDLGVNFFELRLRDFHLGFGRLHIRFRLIDLGIASHGLGLVLRNRLPGRQFRFDRGLIMFFGLVKELLLNAPGRKEGFHPPHLQMAVAHPRRRGFSAFLGPAHRGPGGNQIGLGALHAGFHLAYFGLRLRHAGRVALQLRFQLRHIDRGQHLPLFHGIANVERPFFRIAGNGLLSQKAGNLGEQAYRFESLHRSGLRGKPLQLAFLRKHHLDGYLGLLLLLIRLRIFVGIHNPPCRLRHRCRPARSNPGNAPTQTANDCQTSHYYARTSGRSGSNA